MNAPHRLVGLALGCFLSLTGPLVANEAGDAEPTARSTAAPRDELFFLDGERESWSVSNSKVGCFLVSPLRKKGIRIALGRHATQGVGIFFIGLPLSAVPNSSGEPVVVAAGGRNLARVGHILARDIVFVPLAEDDLALSLRELWYAGTLWVTIIQTSVSQGGRDAKEAVEAYGRTCGAVAKVPS